MPIPLKRSHTAHGQRARLSLVTSGTQAQSVCSQSVSACVPLGILLQRHREEQSKASRHLTLQPTLGESLTLGMGEGWAAASRALRGLWGPSSSSPLPGCPGPLDSTLSAAKPKPQWAVRFPRKCLPGRRAELERKRRPAVHRRSQHSTGAGGGGAVGGPHVKIRWASSSRTPISQASKFRTQLAHYCFYFLAGVGRVEGCRWGFGRAAEAERAGADPLALRASARPAGGGARTSLRNSDLSPPFRDPDREISIFCLGSQTYKRPSSCANLPAQVFLPNAWREGLERQALSSGSRGSRARPALLAPAPGVGPGSPRVSRGVSGGTRLPDGRRSPQGGAPWAAMAGWPLSHQAHVPGAHAPSHLSLRGRRRATPGQAGLWPWGAGVGARLLQK